MELSEHLFRRESGRLVACADANFRHPQPGPGRRRLVQDAFCRALEVWKVRGVPDNPSGWLMAVAKNRALDIVRRERTARTFAPELAPRPRIGMDARTRHRRSVRLPVMRDEQLKMMFSCCHPSLPEETRDCARPEHALRFPEPSEIASAFLVGRAAMEKRISRGRRSWPAKKRLFDLSHADFDSRLSAVRRALYLLFSEGYHSASSETAVRTELCGEAIRMTQLLLEAPLGGAARDLRAGRAHVPACRQTARAG